MSKDNGESVLHKSIDCLVRPNSITLQNWLIEYSAKALSLVFWTTAMLVLLAVCGLLFLMGSIFVIGNITFPTDPFPTDRKSTRLNSSHANISYAVFCLKKK